MRKLSFFLIVCAIILTFVSCKKQKKLTVEKVRNEFIQGPEMEVDSNDTTVVLNLTNQFLEFLKNKDLEKAISMIHYLKDGNEIVSLPAELDRQQRMVLGNFLGLTYHIDELRFVSETDCQVKYTVTLFEKAANDPLSNEVSFYIKPVRRDGHWYLTMADSQSDSTHGSQIKN